MGNSGDSAFATSGSKAPRIFLSHAGEDTDAAKDLAVQFRAAGFDVWLDIDCLQPGDLWQKKIVEGLGEAQAFFVYVGGSGVARWVDLEVQIALERSAKDPQFRVVPVLGPGADPAALPDFLKLFQWLDLRQDSTSPDSLKSLLAAILAKPAERVSLLPPGRAPFRGLLHFDVDDAILFFGRERETLCPGVTIEIPTVAGGSTCVTARGT